MASNRLVPAALAAAFLLAGCAASQDKPKEPPIAINEDPYPSTYVRYPGVPTVIRHATVFDGDGRRFDNGTVVLANGVVQAVGGPEVPSPAGALEIDGTGKWVTPGHHRRPQPPRRLSVAGRVVAIRRQRGDGPGAAGSLGRA